jgi:uncharacterized protein YdeI (YjbR/CyaY-like superfamily)
MAGSKITKTIYVKDRAEWRAWLEKNHAQETEIWLIYYKQGSGRPRVPYEEAVEEALCFAQIDSLVQPIDEEKYAQRSSVRRRGSKWSELNKQRVAKMIGAGKMTPAGYATLTCSDHPEVYVPPKVDPKEQLLIVPPDLEKAFKTNARA